MRKIKHILEVAKRLYKQSLDMIELRKKTERELHEAKRRGLLKEEHQAIGKLEVIDLLLDYGNKSA
jgi:hypothetical protein